MPSATAPTPAATEAGNGAAVPAVASGLAGEPPTAATPSAEGTAASDRTTLPTPAQTGPAVPVPSDSATGTPAPINMPGAEQRTRKRGTEQELRTAADEFFRAVRALLGISEER